MHQILTILLGYLSTTAVAFQPALFQDWYFQSSLAEGQWLYVLAGDIWKSDWPYAQGLGYLYVFDLSESWTTEDVAPNSFANPSDMIDTKQPILWHNPQKDQIGMWAGLPFNTTSSPGAYIIENIETGGASWGDAKVPHDNITGNLLNGLWGSSWCSSTDKLYSLGGFITLNNQNLPVNGMVTDTYSTNLWVNTTSGTPDSRFNVFAEMHFVPNFGDSGVLVLFGGERPPLNQSYSGSPSILADMSSIDVYDIEHSQWYTQQASGDIPGPTTRFGSVGVSAPTNDSFEIFMLPGNGNATFDATDVDNEAFRDVYILSIPGFQWFRANSPDTDRRTGHRCQVVGNRQMLVIGGSLFGDSDQSKTDPHPNGLGIYDLSALQWASTYNATAAAYERPTMVQNYYLDSPTVPDWSDAALSTLFPFRASLQDAPSPSSSPTPTASNTTPSATSSTSSTSSTTSTTETSSSKHKTSVGAIVGGVIGGLAVIILLGAGLVLWRRRRRTAISHEAPRELQDQKLPIQPVLPIHEKDSSPAHVRHELGDRDENPLKSRSGTIRHELS